MYIYIYIYVKSVFLFFIQFLSETFLILQTTQPDITINVHMSSHKLPLFLADFNEIWIPSKDFRKTLKYQVCTKSFQKEPNCCNRTDRRIWRREQSLL